MPRDGGLHSRLRLTPRKNLGATTSQSQVITHLVLARRDGRVLPLLLPRAIQQHFKDTPNGRFLSRLLYQILSSQEIMPRHQNVECNLGSALRGQRAPRLRRDFLLATLDRSPIPDSPIRTALARNPHPPCVTFDQNEPGIKRNGISNSAMMVQLASRSSEAGLT